MGVGLGGNLRIFLFVGGEISIILVLIFTHTVQQVVSGNSPSESNGFNFGGELGAKGLISDLLPHL